MNDSETLGTHFEHLEQHLDHLAARATRAVAELRVESHAILDDVAKWKQQLDLSRVDAELARMETRDDLRRARAAWDEQQVRITRRIDQARHDSATALRALRVGMEQALRDLGESLDVAARGAP